MKISNRAVKITGGVLLTLFAAYVGLAFHLINKTDPAFRSPSDASAASDAVMAEMFKQVYKSQPARFMARDRIELAARRFGNEASLLTVVVLHGVLSSSYTMNRIAGMLQEAGSAEVFALDLRGHGKSSGRPGDVDYIDQYVADLADVVAEIHRRKPQGKVVLAGHSMGGGIALRYAMKQGTPSVDGFLLLSPHLGFNSPTMPQEPASQNKTESASEPFLKLHLPRTLGLIMLNVIGVRHYNDRQTMFFNLPAEFPLRQYSFRSMSSMAPDDYRAGLRAVHQPLLVLVGRNDEAFLAGQFEPAVKQYSAGRVVVLEGESHNSICYSATAVAAAKNWLEKSGLSVPQ